MDLAIPMLAGSQVGASLAPWQLHTGTARLEE